MPDGRGRPIEIALEILDHRWLEELPRARALVRRAVMATLGGAGLRLPAAGANIAVALADDRFVRRLNREHRSKDQPTNVLSYPADRPRRRREARPLGDIVLALGTVRREARAQRKTLSAHATHLVVHGVLHLLGHDHLADRDAEAMEALEVRILARLRIADPYARPDDA